MKEMKKAAGENRKEKREMTAVLENRLRAYERKTKITDDMGLIVALREILAEEEERGDCDYGVVADATETILALGGEDVESFEATAADAAAFRAMAQSRIEGRAASKSDVNGSTANEIDSDGESESRVLVRRDDASRPAKSRRAGKLKWIIPIAAVLAALLAGGAIAGALFLDLFDMDPGTYNSLPFNTVVTGDGVDIEKSDVRARSDGFDVLAAEEYDNLLVPVLPDGWKVESVVTDRLSNASLVEIMLDAGEGKTVRVKALLGLDAALFVPTETIGGYDVAVSEYDGVVQGEFTVGADYYLVQTTDRELLVKTIESLEAMK